MLGSRPMGRATHALVLALLPAAAGCSIKLDSSPPDLPLLGSAPNMADFPRLNHAGVAGSSFVLGNDNAYWLALAETPVDPQWASDVCPLGKPCLRALRMNEPAVEQDFAACLKSSSPCPSQYGDGWMVTWRVFYLLTDVDPNGVGPTELTLQGAGQATGDTFTFPPGPPAMLSGGADDVFVYWPRAAGQKTWFITHRRSRAQRQIAIPSTVDPQNPGGYIVGFNGDGTMIFTRDPKGRTQGWSTVYDNGACDVDVGIRPQSPSIVSAVCDGTKVTGELRTFGDDGIRQVSLEGQPDIVLEPEPVTGGFVAYEQKPGLMDPTLHWWGYYFTKAGDLRSLPLDGTAQPESAGLPQAKRMFGFAPDGTIVYGTVPSNQYLGGASDAWIGPWRFMERGRALQFSGDALRVRWLEHTAQTSYTGDLLSAPLDGDPLRLARNVYEYDELSDGRVLALANRQFEGTQDRIVVIDELKQEARWVAAAAADYTGIPGSNDLLVDVVTGATAHDLVRVPIPPMPCEDIPGAAQHWLDAYAACKTDGDCQIVTSACGMPAGCGAAGSDGVGNGRLAALAAAWKQQACAPVGCEPCPAGPAQKAVCAAGTCALAPK